MSRTLRRKRPRFYAYNYERTTRGKVRDGAPQYVSVQCQHHNACDYCRGNRTFAAKRQAPPMEF